MDYLAAGLRNGEKEKERQEETLPQRNKVRSDRGIMDTQHVPLASVSVHRCTAPHHRKNESGGIKTGCKDETSLSQ